MLRALLGLFCGAALVGCTNLIDHPAGDGGDDGSGDDSGAAGKSSQSGAPGSGGSKPTGGSGTNGGTTGAGAPSPDAQVYVDAHNAVRAEVEEPAGYTGAWVPLPPVTWSETAAAGAQEWADHLATDLDCGLEHAKSSGYGENLAAGTNVGAQRAVDMWASEKSGYTYEKSYAFSSDTGHYTQIVWRKSTRIGCASAKCSRSTVVVCRYEPPGNFLGAEIF
jgi:pathogenesis-related protein 1